MINQDLSFFFFPFMHKYNFFPTAFNPIKILVIWYLKTQLTIKYYVVKFVLFCSYLWDKIIAFLIEPHHPWKTFYSIKENDSLKLGLFIWLVCIFVVSSKMQIYVTFLLLIMNIATIELLNFMGKEESVI